MGKLKQVSGKIPREGLILFVTEHPSTFYPNSESSYISFSLWFSHDSPFNGLCLSLPMTEYHLLLSNLVVDAKPSICIFCGTTPFYMFEIIHYLTLLEFCFFRLPEVKIKLFAYFYIFQFSGDYILV